MRQPSSRAVGIHARLRALLLAVLTLLSACTPARLTTERKVGRVPAAQEPRAAQHAHQHEDVEEADPNNRERMYLPTDFAPVRLSESQFISGLVDLILEAPLQLAYPTTPLYTRRKIVLASAPAWQAEMARDYSLFCERCGTPGDCLRLFDDDPVLQDDDMRRLALALAVGPAIESRDAQLRQMFSTAQLLTTVSLTLAVYLALMVMPELALEHLC